MQEWKKKQGMKICLPFASLDMLKLSMKINVNPVHNAPRLSVTGPGVGGGGGRGLLQTDPTRHSRISTDRARRGGWGRESFITDRPGPIFRMLLHRPLPSPTPQNLCHKHRDLLN